MEGYDHDKIEKKWQDEWEKSGIYRADDESQKPKYYSLMEFPYPSGDGLHTGHVRGYTAMDIISRKRRMQGYNVLFPIGWDAFGLPTENYAIKTGKSPVQVTEENTNNFRKQFKSLGLSFDWSREINTTDPQYYKWTQWIFLQLFKQGLAYKVKMPINWCPKDKIGLANEEVVDGKCERCGTTVEKREKEQWMLAITKYADRLEKDLDTVDYSERIKAQQRNWIGKSEGLIFSSPVKDTDIAIETFSAHFEAFYADTFVVIAPDHQLLTKILDGISNKNEILEKARKMVDERNKSRELKEIEGVFTGRYTLDPVGNGELPIWIANYALADYGTGIIKCSAHDERDFEFAKKYKIRLKPVLFPKDEKLADGVRKLEFCFTDMKNGILSEPKEFDGKVAGENRDAIAEYAVQKGFARRAVTYKLRDWVFSRQRYWGEPIPIVDCKKCGFVPVLEKDLPVELPKVEKYEYTETGESPLASINEWVNVKCPKCDGDAKRETDTMPNWAGSSWYFLAYLFDKQGFSDLASTENWKFQIENYGHFMPVDWYNGGMEHTVLHLLYSRFWNKFLFDLRLVPTSEPYRKRTSHGLILAENGEKMSKSRGNVINPDEIVKNIGADTLRLYEMFMGPFEQSVAWSTDGIVGPRRFLEKVWKIAERIKIQSDISKMNSTQNIENILNKTIKKVSDDIETMSFNTAISTLMVCANEFERCQFIDETVFLNYVKLLAPFAPHIAEEIWHQFGKGTSIHLEAWPIYDESKISDEREIIVIQVNGKVRSSIKAEPNEGQSEIEKRAIEIPEVSKWLEGRNVKRVIYVKGRLINFVV